MARQNHHVHGSNIRCDINPGGRTTINAAAGSKTLRKAGEALFGLHQDAPLPHFSAKALTKQLPQLVGDELPVTGTDRTQGKVAIYVTCYGDHNEPQMVEDLIAV